MPLFSALPSDGNPGSMNRAIWVRSLFTNMAQTAVKTAIYLPSPDENPDADVVIYDGHCKFCTAQVQNLARWDKYSRLTFLSLHDPVVASRYAELTYDQLIEQMYVVDRRGNRYAGADAFRYLTTRLPRLYPLAPLMHIPFTMPLWRWGYQQVAKRRYALGKTAAACEDEACKVHFK
jgi:predicted DCC family thiol-disulfide oxidoreductase YuxK